MARAPPPALTNGPLRSPITHHRSASTLSSRWRAAHGTRPRKTQRNEKGKGSPRPRGPHRAYAGAPHTGHVAAPAGISIPHAPHVFVPPRAGRGGGTASGSCFFLRRIRRRASMIAIARIAMTLPRTTPYASRNVTGRQFTVTAFGPLIEIVTLAATPDASPDQLSMT